MAYTNIFLNYPDCTDLNDFAFKFFTALNIEEYEEHDSAHYINGLYFKTATSSCIIKVSLCDDDDFKDMHFSVLIKGIRELNDEIELNRQVDDMVQ
jgi:hypothetical protein